MQKYLAAFSLLIIATVNGFAQTIPADYQNPDVKKQQKQRTDYFIKLLEQAKVDDALKLIDTSFLNTKNNYRDSLITYHKELSKYLKNTKLYVVVVWPDNNYNTYRCRYSNKKGDFFYIDLYYNIGQPNSSITKILKVPEKELEKDRKELANRIKEEEKTGPPPPPRLSPPGVDISPAKKNE